MFTYMIRRAENGRYGVFRVNKDDAADWHLMAVYKTQSRAETELGYWQGYNGLPIDTELERQSDSYSRGWDAGTCDRPSLDDLTLDVAKEASDPLGY